VFEDSIGNRSIPNLPDDRGRATCAKQELPEFKIDMFVTAAHKELDVFKNAQHNIRGG
jgi:hypothetical protein